MKKLNNMDYTEAIKKIGAEHFEVPVQMLDAKTRKKEIVVARQTTMKMLDEFTEMTLKSIGFSFGGRDHSTAIHAIRTIEDYEYLDKNFHIKVNKLREKIRHLLGLVEEYKIEKIDKYFEELLP